MRPDRPASASSRTTSRSADVRAHGRTALVDEEQPLRRAVENDAEIGPDAGHDPARVERLELGCHVVGVGAARADRLHTERAEDERQRERRRGVAVVDRDAKPSLADRRDVEHVDDVLGVALAHASRVGRLPHLRERGPAQLLAAEVLLDLLLQGARHLVAGPLEDPHLDHLGIAARAADMDACLHRLGLQHVSRHGRG